MPTVAQPVKGGADSRLLFSTLADLMDLGGLPRREQECWALTNVLYKQPLWVGGRALVMLSLSCLCHKEGLGAEAARLEQGLASSRLFLKLKGRGSEGLPRASLSILQDFRARGALSQVFSEDTKGAPPPWSCGLRG